MRLALTFVVSSVVMFGQPATFETASIKPSPADERCGMIQPMTGGALRIECITLKTILTYAYDVQDYQITGGPAWVSTTRWNINAKPDLSASTGQRPVEYGQMSDAERLESGGLLRRRLQALLAERFQLVLKRETKEQTVYALTVAKDGPRIRESAAGSSSWTSRGGNHVRGGASRMAELAHYLATDLKRPVLDRTGLAGRYDFDVKWAPDPSGDAGTATEDAGPSIFTAIQEQLGLKLVAEKGQVETLVIGSASLPDNN